ncbi:flagellar export protein FliJ [Pseudarthrobacter sp. NPDC058362]|uniref:flagellar export protein FliJ n=1 Tax=unclassified Pseudarthrobacter TaxID=2647000 RepID=UPI0036536F45
MARPFPLAGLMRLRRLQEDEAASTLAAANRTAGLHADRQRAARHELDSTSSEASGTPALLAVAAARASARSMLATLDALAVEHQAAAAAAHESYLQARLHAAGIEKLEARHHAAARGEALRAEQIGLDELAVRGRTIGGQH